MYTYRESLTHLTTRHRVVVGGSGDNKENFERLHVKISEYKQELHRLGLNRPSLARDALSVLPSNSSAPRSNTYSKSATKKPTNSTGYSTISTLAAPSNCTCKESNNPTSKPANSTSCYSSSSGSTTSKPTIDFSRVTYRIHSCCDDDNDNDDEVFIDGKEHYLNFLPGKVSKSQSDKGATSSEYLQVPMQQNARRLNSANGVVKVQKVNLVKKISQRSTSGNGNYFSIYLYNTEYMADHYKYMLHNEWMFVLKKHTLTNSNVDLNRRMANVDWLVSVQDLLNLTETILFSAIRIFDYILASLNISPIFYTLTAIVALWISNKYYGHRYISLTKITSLSGNQYSKKQIMKMEIKILTKINFRLNIHEPATFLCHYLQLLKNENKNFIRFACYYIFECVALYSEFAYTAPSLLASTSLYLTLSMTKTDTHPFLNYISRHQDINTVRRYSKHLFQFVQHVTEKKFPYKNTFKKYDKRNVSQFFLNSLSNS